MLSKKMVKISASHILIMHRDSKDSRSDLSKEDALNVVKNGYYTREK